MNKFTYVANLTNHVFPQRVWDALRRYIQTCNDGPYRIEVKPYKPSRSDRQNRYYWGVVVRLLADHCGYTDDEMHDALKWMFLRVSSGNKPDTVRSTKRLTTQEFEVYIETIKRWAAQDMGVYIPDPQKGE
jgi:hypothetical protein